MPKYTPHLVQRIMKFAMSWLFLWPFLDKTFGLGFATESANAWIRGGSPTTGFLTYGTHGPLASLFQSMAGSPIVDWLFMLGLLGVGVGLLIPKIERFSAYVGVLLMLLMWLAMLPPEHNPFLDEHLMYALILIAVTHFKWTAKKT